MHGIPIYHMTLTTKVSSWPKVFSKTFTLKFVQLILVVSLKKPQANNFPKKLKIKNIVCE